MEYTLSIVSGLVSGLISSVIVSIYFKRISDKEHIIQDVNNRRIELLTFIRSLQYELRFYLSTLNQEERDQSLSLIKRMVSTHSLTDKEYPNKIVSTSFIKAKNNLVITLMDMNNDLLSGDYGGKNVRDFLIEKSHKLWKLWSDLRKENIIGVSGSKE